MPRPYRILQNDYPYHITTRTNGRLFRFKPSTFKLFISVLNEVSKKYEAKIQHFQLMSNHYHLKIHTPKENLSQIMHFINGQIAKKINRQLGAKGHLWEERYRLSIISTDEYSQTCVAYIYNNPVRARLCDKAGESEMLSSYDFYAKGKKIEFNVVEDEVYLMLGSDDKERRRRFRELVEVQLSPEKIEMIKNMLRWQFIGPPDFILRMRQKYAFQLRLV